MWSLCKKVGNNQVLCTYLHIYLHSVLWICFVVYTAFVAYICYTCYSSAVHLRKVKRCTVNVTCPYLFLMLILKVLKAYKWMQHIHFCDITCTLYITFVAWSTHLQLVLLLTSRNNVCCMILLPQLHPFNLFSRATWISWYQKGKTSLDLNEARDDAVSGWQRQ